MLKSKLKRILVAILVSVQIVSCFSIVNYGIDRNAKSEYGTLQQELSKAIQQNNNGISTPQTTLDKTVICAFNYIQVIVYFIVVFLVIEKISEKGDELF